MLPKGLATPLSKGFHFYVAPQAAYVTSPGKPAKLGFQGAREQAFARGAPAGGDEGSLAGRVSAQPREELGALGVVGQPVQSQLHGRSLAQSQFYLCGHLFRRGRGNDRADAPNTLPEGIHPTFFRQLIENTACSMP
jgi:hypothetical protein